MKEYYERRAHEYDATTYELMQADPSAAADEAELTAFVESLPPARVLDVGCGTGWLTRLLRGRVVAIDWSESMLGIARTRRPDAVFVLGEVPPLPFLAASFDRVFASHVYSHFAEEPVRRHFVAEAFRVASELVLVEQAPVPGRPPESWETRPLSDGSEHRVFKRYLSAAELADEIGGEIVLESPTFVAVRADT
jgi:ubiquinone/menaquinone biosynthesis C-methylase UbiE